MNLLGIGAKSIRHKLIGIVLLTTFVALTLAGVALVIFDLQSYESSLKAELQTQADIVGTATAPALAFEDAKVARENLSLLKASPTIAAAAIYTAKGALFATFRRDSESAPGFPPLPRAEGVTSDGQYVNAWRQIISNDEVLGSVYLRARDQSTQRLQYFLGVLGLILVISLLTALLLTNRLQSSLTEPIVAISDVARRVMESRDFSLRAARTTDDEVGLLVDAFNDMLTELGRRAEVLEASNQALHASDERYQLAVRGSSAGLWDWNILSNDVFLSPRFKHLLGYSEAELPSSFASFFRALHPADRLPTKRALDAHFSRRRTPFQIELRLRTRQGDYRWFYMGGEAVADSSGKPYRMAGSIIDITARKVAEEALQEANRRKDEFIATLAHELRNPLAPIRTGLQILGAEAATGPSATKAREIIERQLTHMVRLVDDLLDISRITSAKVKLNKAYITLQQIVDASVEASRPYIDASNQRLTMQVAPEAVPVYADLTRMAQALSNILNNAAKYTPPGGRIDLVAFREGDDAVIQVSDNGSGIPQEMLEQVFDMFTQVGRTVDHAQGGLGIGLSIVRRLIGLHEGTVRAHSEGPGQGSTFTIRLPCAEAPPPEFNPRLAPATAAPTASLRVLVVDDNVDAAETMTMLLEMSGHRTAMVHSGLDVLDSALKFQPDVILLDIGLPGMNGYEAAALVRRERQLDGTLLVALTGWGSDADKRAASDAGFDLHLTKPVGPDALMEVLAQVRPSTTQVT
jgi:PAS domain S-box-containing protein